MSSWRGGRSTVTPMRDVLLVVACVVLVLWRQMRASRARTAELRAQGKFLAAKQEILVAEAARLRRALNGDFDA
jgi:hypothetical protein